MGITNCNLVKVNPCTGLDRPCGLQEVLIPIFPRQVIHEGSKVVRATHRPSLLISVRGSVENRAMVRM
jgi:hypothetical protein